MKYLIILLGALSLATAAPMETPVVKISRMLDYYEQAFEVFSTAHAPQILTGYEYDATNFIQNGGNDMFAGTGGNHISLGTDVGVTDLVYGVKSSFGSIMYESRESIPFLAVFHIINDPADLTNQYIFSMTAQFPSEPYYTDVSSPRTIGSSCYGTAITGGIESQANIDELPPSIYPFFMLASNVTVQESLVGDMETYNAVDTDPRSYNIVYRINTNGVAFEAYVIYGLVGMPGMTNVNTMNLYFDVKNTPEFLNLVNLPCDAINGLPIPSIIDCVNGEIFTNEDTLKDMCACDNGWIGDSCDTALPTSIDCVNGEVITNPDTLKDTCVCGSGWGGESCDKRHFAEGCK